MQLLKPAIRYRGKVLVGGTTHANLAVEAMDSGELPPPDKVGSHWPEDIEFGFVTPVGDYLSREQAHDFVVAAATGVVFTCPGQLHTMDLNKG